MEEILNYFKERNINIVAEKINTTMFWIMLEPTYKLFINGLESYNKMKFLYVCVEGDYVNINNEKCSKNRINEQLKLKLYNHINKLRSSYTQIDVKLSDYEYYIDLLNLINYVNLE